MRIDISICKCLCIGVYLYIYGCLCCWTCGLGQRLREICWQSFEKATALDADAEHCSSWVNLKKLCVTQEQITTSWAILAEEPHNRILTWNDKPTSLLNKLCSTISNSTKSPSINWFMFAAWTSCIDVQPDQSANNSFERNMHVLFGWSLTSNASGDVKKT